MLLAAIAAAQAQPAPKNPFEEPDESALFRFDEELVTVASRYAQTIRQAPSIVSIVTADQIRERGYRTLSDVLRDLPGIYVWKSPEGRDLAIFRGVLAPDNNKVLVLVDGVPWFDGAYTHAFIDDYLPLGNVRQVEVIKGPGSAIYGTNAFAGVINVVTWRPEDLDGARIRWVAGSDGRSDIVGSVGAVTRLPAGDVGVVGYARRLGQYGDGLDITPSGVHDPLGEDPKEGLAVGARATFAGLDVQIHHVDWRHSYLTLRSADTVFGLLATDLDTSGLVYHDTFVDAKWALSVKRVTFTPHLWSQRHDDPGAYYFPTTVDADGELQGVVVETEKDTGRWGAGLDFEARPGIDHHAVAGAGIENTVVYGLSDTRYDATDPDGVFTGFGIPDADRRPHPTLCSAFGFGQHSWVAAPALELVGGVRVDRRFACRGGYEPSPAARRLNLSPRVALLLVPSDRVTGKLLYGQAFRYPTVREVLVQAPLDEDGQYTFTNGNRRLVPERIQTAEGELSAQVTDHVAARGDLSWSRLAHEINKLAGPQGSQYQNVRSPLAILGLEAELDVSAGPASGRLAWAFTRARYGPGPFARRVQYEFPAHMLKAHATWAATDHFVATLTGEVYSTRPRRAWSPTAGMQDGRGLALVHLGLRMPDLGPKGRAELDVALRNLFDSRWDTGVYRDDADTLDDGSPRYVEGVEGAGRSLDVAVEVRF